MNQHREKLGCGGGRVVCVLAFSKIIISLNFITYFKIEIQTKINLVCIQIFWLDFRNFSCYSLNTQRKRQKHPDKKTIRRFCKFTAHTSYKKSHYSIPYLQLNERVFKMYSLGFEINADSYVILFQKLPMNVFMNEGCFPNALS